MLCAPDTFAEIERVFLFRMRGAALGAVTNEKPPRGVYSESGDSPRNRLPEGIGSGHCPRPLISKAIPES